MPALLAELDQLEATPVEIVLENPEDTLDLEALQLIGGISLNITKMPLSISKVIISNPLLRAGVNMPAAAFGTGLDVRNARLNALRRACEIYAAHVVDRRKLLSFQSAQKQAYPLLPAERLLVDPSLSAAQVLDAVEPG